ncbi:hypothetical protein BASA82_000654 [Batrachochytrium salamandrivorans]|nr:hypothetical protein BASA82_000654 [Batrachochytrium salamandrivorans]
MVKKVGGAAAAPAAKRVVSDSAAAAPAKKKNKAASLEDQVKQLEDENQALRLQLKVGKESGKHNEQDKADLLDKITTLLKHSTDAHGEEALKAALKSYIVRFSDCSSDHAATVDNHVTQIRRLLAPTKMTRLTLWALNQDDEFFKPTLTPNDSLFSIMNNAMEATPDQLEHFKGYRANARGLVHKLRYTERACDDLIARLRRKNRALNEELHELQEILTPQQLANLLVWSNQNPELHLALKRTWEDESSRAANDAAAVQEEEEDRSQLQRLSAAATEAQGKDFTSDEDD